MLGFLFDPLLVFKPIVAVTIFAIIMLILINLCYRFLGNQQEAKQIKERSKELNKQMKEEQKQGNTEKVNELMKEIMTENNKLMKNTMKPMMLSFVIIILFFPWLHGNYGDLTADLQENTGNITIDNELYLIQSNGEKTDVIRGSTSIFSFTTSAIEEDRKFKIGNDKYVISHKKEGGFIFSHPEQVKFAKIIAEFPEPISLPLFGSDVGWFGWYILVSIPFAIAIRKILKIST